MTNKLPLQTWLDLLRTANRIKKDIDGRLKSEFGQSISRFDALSALHRARRNGVRAGELSRQMFVSEGNITQLMAKLLRDGLVLKRNDLSDARVVIYSLSDEGKTLFERMANTHHRWIEQIFSDIADTDLTHLRELLRQLPAPISQQEVA